jgi:hypothetical protein
MGRQARLPAIMWVSKPMTRPDRTAVPARPASPFPRLPSGRLRPPCWHPASAAAAGPPRPARRPPPPARPTAPAGRRARRGVLCGAGRRQVHGRDRRVGRGCARAGPGRARGPPRPVDRRLQATRRGDRAPRAGPRRPRRAGPRHRRLAGRPAAILTSRPWAAGPPAAAGGRGRRQDPARQRPPRSRAGPPAGGDGPRHRRGPGPDRGGRHDQPDHPVPLLDGLDLAGQVVTADALSRSRHKTRSTPGESRPTGW